MNAVSNCYLVFTAWVLGAVVVLASASPCDAASLRFYGNGVDAPDLDRVKIPIDAVGDSLPGPPVDVGSGDFTFDFWMKASAADNAAASVSCGNNINWIYGNIVLDRDRFNQGRKFGVSIAGGSFVFGVSTESADRTLCGTTNVLDNQWHHVAVQRSASTGAMSIYVDGTLDGSITGPTGDISYPDDGIPCSNCCGGNCNASDPFLVLGAEKHDAGAEFPSYSGFLDELRVSDVVRYTTDFTRPTGPHTTDSATVGLYHMDEGAGDVVGDSAGHLGGPSDGERRFGGTPAGPAWAADTPFGTPDDLDADGKLNAEDECTVLVGSQLLSKAKVAFSGLDDPFGEQAFSMKGSFVPQGGAGIAPHLSGVHLYVEDGGGVVVDLSLPGGLVGSNPSTPCGGRDGWSVKGAATKPVYIYRNRSGFVDAGCSVSSEGVSQVKIKDQTSTSKGSATVQIKAKGAGVTIDNALERLVVSVTMAARPTPSTVPAEAEAGDCGEYRWDPLTTTKPLPFCKPSPPLGALAKLQCKVP